MTGEAPNPWWGYNKERGWVLLDRAWPGNDHGRDGMIVLIQCKDWGMYEKPYEVWKRAVHYQYAPRYIESRRTDRARKLATTRLRNLRLEYEARRSTLLQALIEWRHGVFLESKGVPPTSSLQRAPEGIERQTAGVAAEA
jgi:hypothetical protein